MGFFRFLAEILRVVMVFTGVYLIYSGIRIIIFVYDTTDPEVTMTWAPIQLYLFATVLIIIGILFIIPKIFLLALRGKEPSAITRRYRRIPPGVRVRDRKTGFLGNTTIDDMNICRQDETPVVIYGDSSATNIQTIQLEVMD